MRPRAALTTTRWVITAGLSTSVAVAALCWAEIRSAKNGPRPYETAPDGDGHHGPAGEHPLRVLWLGDSLAAGVGVDHRDQLPAAQTAELLGYRCDTTIRAVPGATVADVLTRQALAINPGDYDTIVVQVGANDVAALTRRAEFRAHYRQLLEHLSPTPVVCVGLPDISTADRLAQPLRAIAGVRGRMLDRITREEAGRAGAAWVDISTRPAHINLRAARALLSLDRYHPGPAGYRLWAERIAAALRTHLPPGDPQPTLAAPAA